MLHTELQQSVGGPSSAGKQPLVAWWGYPWGSQGSGDTTVVRGEFQGSSFLSTDMKTFQYFNNWYGCMNDYRMNMGPLQCEFAFLGEFTLCLVLY